MESLKCVTNPDLNAYLIPRNSEHDVCKQLARDNLFPVEIAVETLWVVLVIHQKCINMHVDIVSHGRIGFRGVLRSVHLLNDVVHVNECLLPVF